MKKLLIFLLLFSSACFAAPPTRQATYSPGETILSTEVTSNEDAVFNYLQSGVDAYSDGTIVNADVNSAANIQSDKLNLTSIAQGVAITSSGSFANAGASTFTGNSTFSGTTIASLGTVTTGSVTYLDLNSATIDNAPIGQSTPHAGTFTSVIANNNLRFGTHSAGTVIYDDGTILGRVSGTANQVLQSNGSSAPTFVGQGLRLLSTTTTTGADNTGDITIAASKKYLVNFTMKKQQTAAGTVYLRFNSNAGASSYAWSYTTLNFATSVTETHVGDNADDEIEISPTLTTDDVDTITGQFFIDTTLFNTSYTSYINGSAVYQDSATTYGRVEFGGMIIDAGGVGAITSFELLDSSTGNDDWVVRVFEFGV